MGLRRESSVPTAPVHLRNRLCLMLATIIAPGGVHGQPGDDLAPGFAKLSAKERTRLAEREREEAAGDSAYQQVMRTAEDAFRAHRYEEALERYERARVMRPLNVYPKVKIQDIQALIARREEEMRMAEASQQDAANVIIEERVAGVDEGERSSRSPTAPGRQPRPALRVEEPPGHHSRTMTRTGPETEPSSVVNNGDERVYREGRAIVVERTVVREGKPVLFKKVSHPWGETMFFQDGQPVPQRVWAAEFGDR